MMGYPIIFSTNSGLITFPTASKGWYSKILSSKLPALRAALSAPYGVNLQAIPKLALGVGHNPDPIPPVRGANGACGYTMPLRIVPERSERPEYLIQSARTKGGDIFDEDVSRLERVDRFGVLKPESAAFSAKSGAFPGEADVLAGEAAAQEINRFNGLPINGSDVSVSLHCRPVFGEHSLTVGVDFNLPRDIKTGSFKAKVKPSYACKKAPDSHLLPRQFPNDDHHRVFKF